MKTNEVNKEISYETLLVTFGEGIGRLNTMFDDPQVWGCLLYTSDAADE